MRRLFNNGRHWRERAEEARTQAEQMRDAETRRVMLDIAVGYDRLAELAEKRKIEDRTRSRLDRQQN